MKQWKSRICQKTECKRNFRVPPINAEQWQPRKCSSGKEQDAAAHWIDLSRVQRVHAQVKAVAKLLVGFLLCVLQVCSNLN